MDFFTWADAEDEYFDDDSNARDNLVDDPDADNHERFSPYEELLDEDDVHQNEELYNEYRELYNDLDTQEGGLNVAEILGLAGAYVTEYDANLSEKAEVKETKRVSLRDITAKQKDVEPSYARKTRFEKWAIDVAMNRKTIHDPID